MPGLPFWRVPSWLWFREAKRRPNNFCEPSSRHTGVGQNLFAVATDKLAPGVTVPELDCFILEQQHLCKLYKCYSYHRFARHLLQPKSFNSMGKRFRRLGIWGLINIPDPQL